MFRAHVLIVRRLKLYYSTSGITTHIGDRPLSQPVHRTATYRCDDIRYCIIQFWPRDDEQVCSKHVEAWNKLIIKFSKSIQMSDFIKIRPVAAELLQADGQPHMKKPTVAFRNFCERAEKPVCHCCTGQIIAVCSEIHTEHINVTIYTHSVPRSKHTPSRL